MPAEKLGDKHDPSLFKDGDTWWFIWQNTLIAPLSKDLSSFTADPTRIDPSGSRTTPEGKTPSTIGHEGATLLKIGTRYVHVGTAWSTDIGRHGSYNLYYCTSEKITGPTAPATSSAASWATAPPSKPRTASGGAPPSTTATPLPSPKTAFEQRNLKDDAQTINQRGLTLVPLEVKTLENGDAQIKALDPAYATPGPDEVQKF